MLLFKIRLFTIYCSTQLLFLLLRMYIWRFAEGLDFMPSKLPISCHITHDLRACISYKSLHKMLPLFPQLWHFQINAEKSVLLLKPFILETFTDYINQTVLSHGFLFRLENLLSQQLRFSYFELENASN